MNFIKTLITFLTRTKWYKFEVERFVKGKWVKSYIYYKNIVVNNIDFNKDWRFKPVNGKRKLVKFIGTEYKSKNF